MKIHLLSMGARFEYEGEEYVKTGPLFATGKGGQRLIPRYAVLRVLGGDQPRPASTGDSLAKADVLKAFNVYYAQCERMTVDTEHGTLHHARETFLKALG
jgi:hypothetical protein